MVEGCGQECLSGHEEDDELRAGGQRLPVLTGSELVDVCPKVTRVCCPASLGGAVVVGRGCLEVRGERHLGVDDDAFSSRKVDHEVGALSFVTVPDGELFAEVAVLDHSGELDDSA